MSLAPLPGFTLWRLMMKNFLKILALISLISNFASAFVIGYKVNQGGPDYLCRLVVREIQTKKLSGACSATLISPTQIVTAAHCVNMLSSGQYEMSAQCGFEGTDPSKLTLETTAGHNLL